MAGSVRAAMTLPRMLTFGFSTLTVFVMTAMPRLDLNLAVPRRKRVAIAAYVLVGGILAWDAWLV